MPTIDLGRVVGPRGEQGQQGVQGIQGVRGPQGIQGNDGVTPDLQVGAVITLAAGSAATVERDPDSPDAAPLFNFGIPKGADAIAPGDMFKAVYDPMSKEQDVFAYADNVKTSTLNSLYSKEQLLSSTCKSALGLSSTATPTQAIDKLRSLIATAQSGVDTLTNAKRFMTGSYTGTQNSTTDYTTKVINTPGMKPLACFISGKGNTHPTGVFILLRDCAWTYNLLFDVNNYIPSVRFDSNSIAIGGVAVPAYGVIEGGTNYSWLAIGE